MKKTIITIAVTLFAVFFILKILNLSSEYTAERAMYKTLSYYDTLPIKTDADLQGMQNKIEKNLSKIIRRFPNSAVTRRAYMNLATLYMEKKDYKEAISLADTILDRYYDDKAIASRAQFIKAKSYELKGPWSKALKEYEILKTRYLDTPFGLQVLLHVAQYYKNNGDTAEAMKAYEEAVRSYSNIALNYRGQLLGYAAASILVETYTQLDRWTEAGNMVQDIIRDYPSDVTYMQQIPKIEDIFVKNLKQPAKAVALYKDIINKAQDPQLITFVDERITALEQ